MTTPETETAQDSEPRIAFIGRPDDEKISDGDADYARQEFRNKGPLSPNKFVLELERIMREVESVRRVAATAALACKSATSDTVADIAETIDKHVNERLYELMRQLSVALWDSEDLYEPM